jgi:hypothetical protein
MLSTGTYDADLISPLLPVISTYCTYFTNRTCDVFKTFLKNLVNLYRSNYEADPA